MLKQRVRKCARCGSSSLGSRVFPANSKIAHQRVWVASLGLDAVSSKRELESIRDRIEAKEDIRWCPIHFDEHGAPKAAQIRSLDGDDVQEKRRKVDDLDEDAVDDSDLHPLSLQQLFDIPPLSLSQLDIQSIDPPTMETVSTYRMDSAISSVPTDSSYRPQLSSQSSQIEEDEEEIEEEEEKTAADFFLVAKANLEPLFRRCQDCGGLIDPISMEWIQIASALSVKFQCTECNVHFRWDSQSKKGTGKSQVFQLNQELPIAAFVTGTPFPRLLECCEVLGIATPKERTMRNAIRFYGSPAIDRVYEEWETDARVTSKAFAPQLIDDGFTVRMRVTDSNSMVDKRLRENPKLKDIEAQRDFWHVQKPLRKKWWKGMKMESCPTLAKWYKSFFNHLYHINSKYPKREDRPLALEYDEEFKLVDKCTHTVSRGLRKRPETKDRREKPEVAEGMYQEYKLIYAMLFDEQFAKVFLACSAEAGTALCESFHSMSLLYSPKRFHCSAHYFNRKMKMSVMHHNSLVFGKIIGERVRRDCLLPRKGRVAISVKRKMSKGTHPWRTEIIGQSWKLRDEYESNRFLKRIGAPDDDIFDVLMVEYGKMLRGEEGGQDEDEEYEWDSDISEEM
uniref:THAP-type domain-containing protein n=1 Tax=Pristionchus pacificus TaxID=54126 RepID=A0A8R1YBP2_PRIPA